MKFNELKISNFRGIDYAELKEMKRLNIIVGKNNSGKTSILEAIFILSGMSNPELLLNINNLRNFQLINDYDFKYIFNDLNLEKAISLSGKVDNVERKAKITSYQDDKRNFPLEREDVVLDEKTNPFVKLSSDLYKMEKSSLQNQRTQIDGLKISFKKDKKPYQDVYISIKNAEIKLSKVYRENVLAKYLNSQIILINEIIDLSSMVKKKQIKSIIDILKEIEPNLIDIQIANNNSIYFDIGKEELLPINIMGDGIRRVLAVLSAMYDMQGGILILDEAENGLHYSSVTVFWKAILMLANQLDIQVITTTHSYEALEALASVQQELNEGKDEIALYRIEKKDYKTKIIHYTNEDFTISLNENYEVR